jgi:DNA gyrase subunit B
VEGTGQKLAGQRLVKQMESLSSYLETAERLIRRGSPMVLLQALIKARVNSKAVFSDKAKCQELASFLAEQGLIIDRLEADEEHSLFEIFLTVPGEASQAAHVSWDLITSADYAQLYRLAEALAGAEQGPYTLSRNGDDLSLANAQALLESLLAAGAKGLNLQRYKGLGEMNPEQLWETTMDPERRTLLQVKVEDDVIADDLFTTLMGDQVEPRRDFIYDNALEVRALDI